MAKYEWAGDAGFTLIDPVTGAPVALEPGQVVDLPETVAVSPESWRRVKPQAAKAEKKESAQ